MTKKVLVCGATGFIGRNIAESLAADYHYEVTGVYNKRSPFKNGMIDFVQADLRKEEDVARVVSGHDIIIQAAATTSGAKDIVTKPSHHVTDNAVMNSLVFRSAHENKIKNVVFFSCSVMYRSSGIVSETDFDANDVLHPNYFGVGWTKVYLEKMCEFYSKISETKYTAIRHSNIYGPHDKFDLEKSHVFGATVAKVMSAIDKVNVWGSGEEERDLLYISDLVDFVEIALKKQTDPFRLINVGAGTSVSIKSLVQKIINHSERKLTIQFDTTKPTIKTKLALDCTQAKEVFDWSPKISLDDGIRKTLYWYKENLHREKTQELKSPSEITL
jgi:GDP-L-fucose synthase